MFDFCNTGKKPIYFYSWNCSIWPENFHFFDSTIFPHEKCNFLPRKPPQNAFYTPQSCLKRVTQNLQIVFDTHKILFGLLEVTLKFHIHSRENQRIWRRKWESHKISKIREYFSIKKCNFLPRKPTQILFIPPKVAPVCYLKACR